MKTLFTPLPTISHCIFVHNDLPMLKAILMHERRFTDQTCILDLGSTDGTREFCEAYLGDNDSYEYRSKNTCPILGFGEARTASMKMATKEWIYSSGANCVMAWRHHGHVKEKLANAKADVLEIVTEHIEPFEDCNPSKIEKAIAHGPSGREERHRVFIRAGQGIEFKGYIHEEAYRGNCNTYEEREQVDLYRFHFDGWSHNRLRLIRYAWMLLNASDKPELQHYTNRWWYDVYFPQQKSEILVLAKEYEETVLCKGML